MRCLGFIRNFVLVALLLTSLPARSVEPEPVERLDTREAEAPRLRVRNPRAAAAETAEVQTPGYRLATNDTLDITVFGEEDLSTTARVGKDGAVAIPLVGLVKIGGQTVREAAVTIEGRLREYLIKPQVALTILTYSKRRFTILGSVSRPGTYDLPDEATIDLLEAIGMAGGYTRIANPSKVTLKRLVQGREMLLKLDARSMVDKQAGERVQVLPGDTIIVAERLF